MPSLSAGSSTSTARSPPMAFSMPMSDLIQSFTASLSNKLANLGAHFSKTPYHILYLELLALLGLPVLLVTSYARYRRHINTRVFKLWNFSVLLLCWMTSVIAKDFARYGWRSQKPYFTTIEIYGNLFAFVVLQKTIAVPPELEPTCDNTATLAYSVATAVRRAKIRLVRAWNVVARRRSPSLDAFKVMVPMLAIFWIDYRMSDVHLPLELKLKMFLALLLTWAWLWFVLARKYRADRLRLEREERDGVDEKPITMQGQVETSCEETRDEKADLLGDV